MNFNRRHFIKTASSLTLATAVPSLSWAAGSCGKDLVVGTWGGDYQRLLQQNIDPLVKPDGINVVYDVGAALQRQTKLRAERGARRSTMDIALLRDNDMYQMAHEDTLAPLDAAALPNLQHVIPTLKTDYAIPHIFSALVLVYNTEFLKTAPESFASLLDPGLKGKVGVVDDQYDYLTLAGALASGKSGDDLQAGQDFLLALRDNAPKVYPSVDALASALKSGEIWVTMTWKARALQWSKAALPVAYVFPKEGALPATFCAGLSGGGKNGACAARYLNSMLEPQAQLAFAETMGYAPTVLNATLPPSLQDSVGFNSAQLDQLVPVNFELLMQNKSQLLDFWNRQFRAGL
ncbi:extracellular solute-binding protein [Pusillimonas sp. SM2304]|uniref:ABC transporter substrate-binding protein n=1 Tax=Pusillimonas sp. SM2304 TaxID=3073241 RepID=UPI002876B8C0|nr:extracellular solute-binding protein [Pusillimonas sp. SM2304]MDS1139035.1 extracellular solute-binding protein [Pusillimonas sp. SM2304]